MHEPITHFQPGCALPDIQSIIIGMYQSSTSGSGYESSASVAIRIKFTSVEARDKYQFARIERADNDYLLVRLMKSRDAFFKKGPNGASKLLPYNNSEREVITNRLQRYIGFNEIQSEMDENTVSINAASGLIDDDLHIFLKIYSTRNNTEYKASEELQKNVPNERTPEFTPPPPTKPMPAIGQGVLMIPSSLSQDKQLQMIELANSTGRDWQIT